ncbi:MAG: SAM-dependent methyltransferase [Opitutaceae bacterium]|jgi:tRNA (guanine-N7-)-methyltransferase|nr:SAM-dependent methyltransferase [Opitutaceae bacterium]
MTTGASAPSVENPARTADFFARRDARLAALRETLAALLRGQPRITLEIGCGHGHFLTAYAAAHSVPLSAFHQLSADGQPPQTPFCVGIDLIGERIARARRKAVRARLESRLAFLQAEAGEFLASLPDGTGFADIFILFPDPWPKRRHHKNRLIQPQILSALAARSGPGTRLCFRTDYAPYFEDAWETMAAHADWKIDSALPWPFEQDTVFQNRAKMYQSFIARRVS